MNIIRNHLGLPPVDDKYSVQFPGVADTIKRHQNQLIVMAKETLSFGHVASLAHSTFSGSMLSKELVDEDAQNAEFELDLYNSTFETHQLNNDLAMMRVLSPLFVPITAPVQMDPSEFYRFIAQQDESVVTRLMDAPQWEAVAGLFQLPPLDRAIEMIQRQTGDVGQVAIDNGSIWGLEKTVPTVSAEMLITAISGAQRIFVEWASRSRSSDFESICIGFPGAFKAAIRSGDLAIYKTVAAVLPPGGPMLAAFEGQHPIHDAVRGGCSEIVEDLVTRYGFDVNEVDFDRRSPLATAAVRNMPGMIRGLRRVGGAAIRKAEIMALLNGATSRNRSDIVQALIVPVRPNESISQILNCYIVIFYDDGDRTRYSTGCWTHFEL